MELIILKILRPVPLTRKEKGPVRHIDTFQGNTFYHEGHEEHEEVAIRLIAHRVASGEWRVASYGFLKREARAPIEVDSDKYRDRSADAVSGLTYF
jgi:hypothetical protein